MSPGEVAPLGDDTNPRKVRWATATMSERVRGYGTLSTHHRTPCCGQFVRLLPFQMSPPYSDSDHSEGNRYWPPQPGVDVPPERPVLWPGDRFQSDRPAPGA